MTPHIVPDLIEAFRRSKTMFAALELGVFEATPTTAALALGLSFFPIVLVLLVWVMSTSVWVVPNPSVSSREMFLPSH